MGEKPLIAPYDLARGLLEFALIVGLVILGFVLLRVSDLEPALPKCRTPQTTVRCEP